MTRKRYDDALMDIIGPQVESLGFTLWGIDMASAGRRTLVRIYIDSENGVSIDDCAAVSRQVGTALEVEDIMHGAYVLEVSSPGLERRFFSVEQLQDYLQSRLVVRLHEARDGVKKFEGILKSVEDGSFVLALEDEDVQFDWDQVKKATLVHDFQ